MATNPATPGQREAYPQWAGQPGTEPVVAPNGDLFFRLRKWVRDSLEKHSDWYTEARECFDFVAGRQWTDTDKDALAETGRVPIEFNRIGPIVDAICGMEVNNRQEVKYLPRTQGDVEANEKLSSLAEWARDECQAEDEESEAFRDAVICGRGWTETRLDFDEEPTGKIAVDRIDPLQAGADPGSVKANFTDARYLWRYRDIDTDEAKVMFPGVMAPAIDARWATDIRPVDGGEGNKRDYPDETRAALKEDLAPKQCRVVLIQWWEQSTAYMVAHPMSPEPVEVPEEQYLAMQAELDGVGATAAKIRRRTYRQAFLGRDGILDEGEIDGFTLAAITGKRDRNKGFHYGVVRPMRDPQRLANTTLANVLHILKSNAKGGLLAEKTAFANPRDAEKDWSNPSKTVLVNEGRIAAIKERTAPQIPASLPVLQEFSISSIRDVTGVSVELLGLADRDQAASLEYQRRQSAMTILAPLFDALRRYRKTQGRIMIGQLKKLPPGVLVRVVSDEDESADQAGGQAPKPQFVPFDPEAFGLSGDQVRFDVVVDEAPSSPNQKEATWAVVQPMMQAIAQNPQAIGVALKYSPLPSAAAKEFTEALSGPQIPPEVQQLIEQGQRTIEEQGREIERLKGDQSVKEGKLEVDAFNADTKRREADSRAMMEALKHMTDRMDKLMQHVGAKEDQDG